MPTFHTVPSGAKRGWAWNGIPFRSSRRVTNRSVARVRRPSAAASPPSHRAQTLSPVTMTAVLAALASSGDPIRARLSPTVPKPGVTTASSSVSVRRLGVSAKRAARVTPPSRHRERPHQAVAVEPVGGAAARAPELARTVAEQRPLQPRRRPAVDQPHGARRDVALEVGGGQGPGGGDLLGDRGADHLGRGDGGGQGGGAHQEMAAGGVMSRWLAARVAGGRT